MRRAVYGRMVIGGAVVAAFALSGCSLTDRSVNVVDGKRQFVEQCGACHVLARAGTTGTAGPNLDTAFARSRKDGLGESTIEGVVHQQILHPSTEAQIDPATGKPLPLMPAKLVTGTAARNVAAYVAQAAGVPGEDEGRLATVGASQAEGTAEAENGVLEIPVAPSGLAYVFADARAPAGQLTIRSENPQPVPHDIAIDGISEKGDIVSDGGVSEFTTTLQPGEYTFYCTVEGHRAGGMEGTLVVE
jgi:plastocyanin